MIEVKNLSKKYGPIPAVKDISFKVDQGAVYGFLGPNGAGKSTTMNMICGCLAPTQGSITVNGFDIIGDAVEAKRCIGYLPEQPPLYMDMTPFEYLEFVALAKGLRKEELYDELEFVMEKTGIADVADRLIRNLSKGYKQRVGIAQAIVGDPDIIILDEPTVGLDPLQIIEIRSLIKELGEEHTVILSSHILQEIEAVCDHVIMISKGRIVADESFEALTKNETLEEAFVRLAGESLDAGAAYAMERSSDKEEKLSRKGKKRVITESEKGAAYYEEIFVDEEPEADDEETEDEE
ncbi:MAG: ABC transporter ATP-binding protein [Clostridia bacterium]|nr:ABC transporter ATP-binding protein [Clostridia bacterium]